MFNTKLTPSTILVGLLVLTFLMYMYCQQTSRGVELMEPEYAPYNLDAQTPRNPIRAARSASRNPNANHHSHPAQLADPPAQGDAPPSTCNPANFASASLLPKMNDVVRDEAFDLAPKDLQNINFTDAKSRIGENTIQNNLRNPNLQLRAEPANPQIPVSPWLNSTIEPDLHRKPWE